MKQRWKNNCGQPGIIYSLLVIKRLSKLKNNKWVLSARLKYTENIQAADLGCHRVGVDLTHVAAFIGLLEVSNVEFPRAIDDVLLAASGDAVVSGAANRGGTSAGFVGDRVARVLNQGLFSQRENRLIWAPQPADLRTIFTLRLVLTLFVSADQTHLLFIRSLEKLPFMTFLNCEKILLLNDWSMVGKMK